MSETQTPYVCPVCGRGWITNLTRCIGTDGKHRPTIVIRNRFWRFWR